MIAIAPPRLRPGQTIGVCAPAGAVKPERVQRGLARLAQMDKAFKIRLAPTLTAEHRAGVPGYLSNTDEARAEELMALLADPDVRAVVLARGGYGIMRILAALDPAVLRADPKPIVGFSDATALLSWAAVSAGVRGIHGPMIGQLGDLEDADVARLVTALTDPAPAGELPWELRAQGSGIHAGELVTANLTLASLLVGTPWALPLDGALLMIEEIGERPYEIDRYLTQLTLTGELARTRAVIVGDLTRCTDAAPSSGKADPDDAALRVVLERMRAAGTPVAVGAPVGHGDRNWAVPFGARAELDLDRGVLRIDDGAVA